MTVNSNFIVKNGLEVAEKLIFADGNKNKVGINTVSLEYDLDVNGDVALTGRLFVTPKNPVAQDSGTLFGNNPFFIAGVNTSLYRVNDVLDDGPGGFLSNNTKVTSIGISSVGIFPSHGRLVGSAITTYSIIRRVSSGQNGQVLTSKGPNLPPIWDDLEEEVSIEETFENDVKFLTFVDGAGKQILKVTSDQLSFIPFSGNFGIGTSNPTAKLDVVGDANFTDTVVAPLFEGDLLADNVETDNLLVTGISTFESNASFESDVEIEDDLTINTGNLGIGVQNPSEKLEVDGNGIFSGNVTADFFVGIASTTVDVTILDKSSNQVHYPTFVTDSGTEVININKNTLSFIPNSGNLGLGTGTPQRTLDVIGDISFSNRLFVRSTPGTNEQVLISRGPSSPAEWVDPEEISQTTVENTNQNKTFYPIFTDVTTGVAELKVDSNSLAYNPSTNRLGIGKTNPVTTLDVGGDVTAFKYFGDGENLVGIVTQIISGIGLNQGSTQSPGKGVVTLDAYKPVGKTIYVSQTGDDNNTGLAENHPKRTIKAAATAAIFGDTIKVFPGVYVEENPIILKKTVSVEGTELRNCVVTPKYPYLDLFHVNNGSHITDMSFIGPEMTDGAAVVALQPLEGVSVDRYFDAARLIRNNLDFIASETVGFLTSTQYIGAGRTQITDPTFTIVNSSGVSTDPVNCSDDIKSILKCVIHDITRGGNSRCVDAGKSYYDNEFNLLHITGTDINGYSVKAATIDTINYAAGVARAVVNNVTWGGHPAGIGTVVTNAVYNKNTGITTVTANNHNLLKDDAVKIVGLAFTCPSGPGIVTYPSGSLGYIFNVLKVLDNNNFEVVVGQSTLPHTYVSGGTIQKYEKFGHNFYQLKDVSIQPDPLTGFNNAIDGCANVISAIYSCVGIVTNIVGLGSTAFSTVGIKTTYPGNSGIGFTTVIGITSAVYNKDTGRTTIVAPGFNVVEGDQIELRELSFSCPSNGSGISTQLFPSGKYGYDFSVDKVNLDGSFDVFVGPSTLPHTYRGGGVIVNRAVAVTTAVYSNTTGITTITAPGAFVREGDLITLRDLGFSCPSGPGIVTYPSGKNGYNFTVNQVIGVGSTFVVNVGVSTLPHFYQSGGVVIPPFSRGVGPITQGPYVRNCTNFIPKSIGMKVDGFDAEPGDKDDIGVTGTMSVDSYTQYNQGGIGVSITNGAYSQLVSIFTICDDIAIFTGSGGQCDITNSNSSFGNLGLVSNGVGDETTGSIYRYTGIASSAQSEQPVIAVSGMGNLRPYDGQALYFGELYYEVRSIKITNGGIGYNQPPRVTVDFPTGPNGIRAEAISTIDAFGRVVSIDMISPGNQYRISDSPQITIAPPDSGITATAEPELYPLYYTIESATLPSAGISTITLNTDLNNNVSAGTTVYFTRLSLQIVSSHSFEWVGSGNDINIAKPALGGVVRQENEVVKINGGEVFYTSTDQAGNFRIGDGFVINQLTGTVTGRSFDQSILNNVTPLIIALGR